MRLVDADAFIQRLFDYAITDSDIEFCEKVKFALESEPILNDGWIPVTKGLPKEGDEYPYLVTWNYWDELSIELAYFGKMSPRKKGKPCFYTSDSEYGDVPMPENSVTAWMPSPKPYEEEVLTTIDKWKEQQRNG